MPAKGRGVYTPKQDMIVQDENGVPITLRAGVTRIREGHYLLKSREDFFKPVEDTVDYEVEQATAAPGEKRGARA